MIFVENVSAPPSCLLKLSKFASFFKYCNCNPSFAKKLLMTRRFFIIFLTLLGFFSARKLINCMHLLLFDTSNVIDSSLQIEPQLINTENRINNCGVAAITASRISIRMLTHHVRCFDLIELNIETNEKVSNPFDSMQFDLCVRFVSPSGQGICAPAFWFQEFDDKLQLKGTPVWRVRFTPTEAGDWAAQAELVNCNLTSLSVRFYVAPNTAARGFIRIHSKNSHYFAYDNGDFFFPIGLNLAWSTQQGLAVLEDFTSWLDSLSRNGGNIVRVWMASWAFAIEWNDTGLGDYSKRQAQAWLLDQVFKLAEERGIVIMLSLINHGQFSVIVNSEWSDNPYNIFNGGMLILPVQFVTNRESKELFKRRLRYIAARYGYSTSLFAWEWWNEVNWTLISECDLIPWIHEMTAYLRKFDPYSHLISISFSDGSNSNVWKLPEISFSQQHDYTGADPICEFSHSKKLIMATAPNKPILQSEHGFVTSGVDKRDVTHFHDGLWAAPFLGYAGSSMYWWWDIMIDACSLWDEFQSLATFLEGEDLSTLQVVTPTVTGGHVSGLALQTDDHMLLWLRRDVYLDLGMPSTPALIDGITVSLSGFKNGKYRARWYDTQSEQWLMETAIIVSKGLATLHPPAFQRDLAVKLDIQ